METKNLKQSPTGVWMYRRRVPTVLSEYYDQSFIYFSLETKSLTEARIKRDAINAEIDLKVHEMKSSRPSKARFNQLFTELRNEFLAGERRERATGEENMFTYAYDRDKKAIRDDKTYVDAIDAVLTGEVPDKYRLTITDLADEWHKANKGKKSDKYVSSVPTYSKAFIEYLGAEEFPEIITPGMAQKFIDYLLDEGKSPGTIAHYKSKLAEVWRWGLARDKFAGTNPWTDVKIEATAEQKEQDHYRNLTIEEAKLLIDETTVEKLTSDTYNYPFVTHCAARMLPFLGCRLSELVRAKREQVKEVDGRYLIEVWKGKTKNAQRVIPVCEVVEPLLKEALRRSEGKEYLFPELTEDKQSNSVSGRIGKITKKFEKQEGFKTSAHSLRGHFATALEEVGCPEELAVILAGHKRLSLTYDLYSKHKATGKLWPYVDRLGEAESLNAWIR